MFNNVISPKYNKKGRIIRRICSFVRRSGYLTQRQDNALKNIWAEMGIDFIAEPFDLTTMFNNQNPIVLEIGFGMGTSLVMMASKNRDKNFLGIEVYTPGVGACLALGKEEEVTNLRIICHDAIEVLDYMIPNESISIIQLFFPDPWHKVKHNKRRIVQMHFANKIRHKLVIGGVVHMATDWEPYAKHMLSVMNNSIGYKNVSSSGNYLPRPKTRPETKFEQRGLRLGHNIWDLMFERTK
ncbi:tRNA (guanine-N(7)-)-methyltransferase [Candidatus Hartigia pinicola]|nr:tRNA (guanine-N(7)-)-methyltransferase [Candidatus Hartigia pinicola]